MKEKYFKLDQDVWYMGKIKGKVAEIGEDHEMYPITVIFDDDTSSTFTSEGKLEEDNDYISLYQKPFELPKNEPFFQERPAYFYRSASETWAYDILCEIDKFGNGLAKNANTLFSLWQYEPPTL